MFGFLMQNTWRSFQARQQLAAARFLNKAVYAAWLGHCVRRDQRKLTAAVTALQKQWYVKLNKRIMAIQQASLAHIGALVFGWQGRRHYQRSRAAVILCQSVVRRRHARVSFLQQRSAAVSVQSQWRGHAARHLFRANRAAATTVTAAFRAFVSRRQYARMRSCAVTIQSMFRGHHARSELFRDLQAALLVQSVWRMSQARRAFQTQRRASIAIASTWKAKHARTAFQRQRTASAVLQRGYRGVLARRAALAACSIRARWRLRARAAEFPRFMHALRRIQTHSLKHIREVMKLAALQRASVLIGRRARAHLTQSRFRHIKHATVAVQRWWRAIRDRLHFLLARHAACTIQSKYREHTRLLQGRAARAVQRQLADVARRAAASRRHRACKVIQVCHRGILFGALAVKRNLCMHLTVRIALVNLALVSARDTD